MSAFDIRIDARPDAQAFQALRVAAWGTEVDAGDLNRVFERSLAFLCAYESERLVGYVYVAWDGGVHAFLLDPTVHPDHRRQGLGRLLVERATAAARERGAEWLHVDYEPHLEGFYRSCGFQPALAGLIRL